MRDMRLGEYRELTRLRAAGARTRPIEGETKMGSEDDNFVEQDITGFHAYLAKCPLKSIFYLGKVSNSFQKKKKVC